AGAEGEDIVRSASERVRAVGGGIRGRSVELLRCRSYFSLILLFCFGDVSPACSTRVSFALFNPSVQNQSLSVGCFVSFNWNKERENQISLVLSSRLAI